MNGKLIAEQLQKIKNGIDGALNNPDILSRLSPYSYNVERIMKGRQMLDKTTELMLAQVGGYGNQYLASSEFDKVWSEGYSRYMVTLKVVRVVFKGQPERLMRLNATGKRNKSLSGWLRDARILYTHLSDTPEVLEKMEPFGYSAERIQEELRQLEEVEKMRTKQLNEKGIAQQATVERDKAFDELCNWYSDFRAIARIALYDKPQLLEVMGIVKK
jgi:hypothetical protein